jgi:hypothetical protein
MNTLTHTSTSYSNHSTPSEVSADRAVSQKEQPGAVYISTAGSRTGLTRGRGGLREGASPVAEASVRMSRTKRSALKGFGLETATGTVRARRKHVRGCGRPMA